MLKKETNIVNEKIITFRLVFNIPSRLLVGKNPPDEIRLIAKLNDIKDLMSIK